MRQPHHHILKCQYQGFLWKPFLLVCPEITHIMAKLQFDKAQVLFFKQSSESKNSHKNCCEHRILLRNTPTDIPTPPLSAILLEAFDRKVPLRKEWPEKLTTDLCLLKSCRSSDLQKIRQEILYFHELQCRHWLRLFCLNWPISNTPGKGMNA